MYVIVISIWSINCKVSPIGYKTKIHENGVRRWCSADPCTPKSKLIALFKLRTAGTARMPAHWQLHEAVCCSHAVELFFHDKIALWHMLQHRCALETYSPWSEPATEVSPGRLTHGAPTGSKFFQAEKRKGDWGWGGLGFCCVMCSESLFGVSRF